MATVNIASAAEAPLLLRIAFGSCHSRAALSKRLSKSKITESPTIWGTIASTIQPHAFLWTGDAIYPPKKIKGDTPLDVMQNEYQQMLHNETLGYAQFLRRDDILMGGVHGTWDDHDYGGNDRGRELDNREDRRDAYLDFLHMPKDSERWEQNGAYGSIEFGENVDHNHLHGKRSKNKVKVIFLDTRWHRERHCIPSVGSNPHIPYGALIACATRWITAGFDLPSILSRWTSCSNDSELLGEGQWNWLEQQLQESNASMHVVVSSIQVLTTNPVVESWGHFPSERERLLKLLNHVPGLVILSGDVHHAEISSTAPGKNAFTDGTDYVMKRKVANKGAIVEVTSSGLTHSCDEPFYGPLCQPILDSFPAHRFEGGNVKGESEPSYFTSRNFGSIDIDWVSRLFRVNVHDYVGDVVLTAGFEMDTVAGMPDQGMSGVAKCIDGSLWPSLMCGSIIQACLFSFCLAVIYLRPNSMQQYANAEKVKRTGPHLQTKY